MRRTTAWPSLVAIFLAVGAGSSGVPVFAQQSASYANKEFVFNSGGHPANGAVLASASYRIRLGSLGERLIGSSLASASFQVEVGFVGVYPPPDEVTDLRFDTDTGFHWSPEPSAGTYSVYRDALSLLPGSFGACLQPAVALTSTTDLTDPALGTGRFYLVTVRNRLHEEGTKGFRSSGTERPNAAPCP